MTISNPEIYSEQDKSAVYGSKLFNLRLEEASQVESIDEALDLIFPTEEVESQTSKLLDEANFYMKSNGRRWAVAFLEGSDPRSIIAKRVEAERFSTFFGTHPFKHVSDYGIYDNASLFVTVIDADNPEGPRPASALRIVKDNPQGFKTINSLASPDEDENPWADDFKMIFGEYTEHDKKRIEYLIQQAFGVVRPETTWAIESMAVLEEYAGKSGLVGEASFPLYAVCLQESNRAGIETWVSIQDIKPMLQMQNLFNSPWEWLHVPPRAYDGELPTIPTSIPDMQLAQDRLRQASEDMGRLLIDGIGLERDYVMPEELQGEEYLNTLIKK